MRVSVYLASYLREFAGGRSVVALDGEFATVSDVLGALWACAPRRAAPDGGRDGADPAARQRVRRAGEREGRRGPFDEGVRRGGGLDLAGGEWGIGYDREHAATAVFDLGAAGTFGGVGGVLPDVLGARAAVDGESPVAELAGLGEPERL